MAGNQDSITSKLLWIVIGVVVAGVVGIPINYLLVRPLTPKAELSIEMLGLGEIWIKNSTSLTANHVTVSVNFYNGDWMTSRPNVKTVTFNPLCKRPSPSDFVFTCERIEPWSIYSFDFSTRKPADFIYIKVNSDDYQTAKSYLVCDPSRTHPSYRVIEFQYPGAFIGDAFKSALNDKCAAS